MDYVQMDGIMDVSTNECMYEGPMHVQMDRPTFYGWMDVLMDVSMYLWIYQSIYGLMDVLMNG